MFHPYWLFFLFFTTALWPNSAKCGCGNKWIFQISSFEILHFLTRFYQKKELLLYAFLYFVVWWLFQSQFVQCQRERIFSICQHIFEAVQLNFGPSSWIFRLCRFFPHLFLNTRLRRAFTLRLLASQHNTDWKPNTHYCLQIAYISWKKTSHCYKVRFIKNEIPFMRLLYSSSVYTVEVSISTSEFYQFMRRLDVGTQTNK